jgi:hypothetical protein
MAVLNAWPLRALLDAKSLSHSKFPAAWLSRQSCFRLGPARSDFVISFYAASAVCAVGCDRLQVQVLSVEEI